MAGDAIVVAASPKELERLVLKRKSVGKEVYGVLCGLMRSHSGGLYAPQVQIFQALPAIEHRHFVIGPEPVDRRTLPGFNPYRQRAAPVATTTQKSRRL